MAIFNSYVSLPEDIPCLIIILCILAATETGLFPIVSRTLFPPLSRSERIVVSAASPPAKEEAGEWLRGSVLVAYPLVINHG